MPKTGMRRRRSRILLALLVAFGVWATEKWWEQEQLLRDQEATLARLKQEAVDLGRTREALAAQVKRLENEEYVVELARRYFFLSKPGETLYLTPRTPQSSPTDQALR